MPAGKTPTISPTRAARVRSKTFGAALEIAHEEGLRVSSGEQMSLTQVASMVVDPQMRRGVSASWRKRRQMCPGGCLLER